MEFMLVSVPLFDKYLSVEAYLFRYRINGRTALAPDAVQSPPLDALIEIGAEAFAGGNPILVPVTLGMLERLAGSCPLPEPSTVFFIESLEGLGDVHIDLIAVLRRKGYRIAVMQSDKYIDNDKLLRQTDFVLFGEGAMAGSDRKPIIIRYTRGFKQIKTVAMGLNDDDEFENAKRDEFQLYEGMFYRVPSQKADQGLTPIKSNLIQLLNMVRDENFEFKDISAVMRRDTALSYSMMRFINSPYLGIRYKVKSIQQAVTILGQIEVRKWVTAAVFKALGSDRPSELTRISLVRAKLAENLTDLFRLDQEDAASLFLMGLFSVLGIMLGCSIEEALEQVLVSDEIADALLRGEGRFVPVLRYIVDYEKAHWDSVAARNEECGLQSNEVHCAYIEAVGWYNELLSTKVPDARHPQSNRPSTRPDW